MSGSILTICDSYLSVVFLSSSRAYEWNGDEYGHGWAMALHVTPTFKTKLNEKGDVSTFELFFQLFLLYFSTFSKFPPCTTLIVHRVSPLHRSKRRKGGILKRSHDDAHPGVPRGADLRRQTPEKKKKGERKVLAANLFITTSASLSPSPAANANVGHLGKK